MRPRLRLSLDVRWARKKKKTLAVENLWQYMYDLRNSMTWHILKIFRWVTFSPSYSWSLAQLSVNNLDYGHLSQDATAWQPKCKFAGGSRIFTCCMAATEVLRKSKNVTVTGRFSFISVSGYPGTFGGYVVAVQRQAGRSSTMLTDRRLSKVPENVWR